MHFYFDPRTKLLFLLLINIIAFTSPDLRTEMVCMGAVLILVLLMGAYKQAIRGLLVYAGMMAVLILSAYLPGMLGSYISMMVICFRKVALVVTYASGFIATTKVGELICALQKLRMPKSIVVPFAVTMRFFPTAKEEFHCISDAMKLRGIQLSFKNLITRPHIVFESIMVPMVLRCASIAEELSAAAITRGIESDRCRSSIHTLSWKAVDVMGSISFSALAVFSLLGGVPALYG